MLQYKTNSISEEPTPKIYDRMAYRSQRRYPHESFPSMFSQQRKKFRKPKEERALQSTEEDKEEDYGEGFNKQLWQDLERIEQKQEKSLNFKKASLQIDYCDTKLRRKGVKEAEIDMFEEEFPEEDVEKIMSYAFDQNENATKTRSDTKTFYENTLRLQSTMGDEDAKSLPEITLNDEEKDMLILEYKLDLQEFDSADHYKIDYETLDLEKDAKFSDAYSDSKSLPK